MFKKDPNTFYGLKIIADNDISSAKGLYVIEKNHAGQLICRYYNSSGNPDQNFTRLDPIIEMTVIYPTPRKVVKEIKTVIKKTNLVISKSAVQRIQDEYSR